MSLTNTQLTKLLSKEYNKPFELSDRDSLSVRVSAKGKIAWQYRYRFDGKPDRVTLGHYPYISLSEARAWVPSLRGLVVDGKNPKLEWKERKNKSIQKSQFTLSKLSKLWFDEVAEVEFKNTTHDNYESTIRKWILNEPKIDKIKEKWVKKTRDPF